MHGVPARVLLRHLLAESGGSRTAAARHVGVGRSTLYRWIATGLLDEPIETIQARYRPRPRVASKLEPYKPLIQARLAEFPALQATRLFAECRAAGCYKLTLSSNIARQGAHAFYDSLGFERHGYSFLARP